MAGWLISRPVHMLAWIGWSSTLNHLPIQNDKCLIYKHTHVSAVAQAHPGRLLIRDGGASDHLAAGQQRVLQQGSGRQPRPIHGCHSLVHRPEAERSSRESQAQTEAQLAQPHAVQSALATVPLPAVRRSDGVPACSLFAAADVHRCLNSIKAAASEPPLTAAIHTHAAGLPSPRTTISSWAPARLQTCPALQPRLQPRVAAPRCSPGCRPAPRCSPALQTGRALQ